MTLGMEKLEWCGYPSVKKIEDILFDRVHERDGRTDRQTGRQTPHDGVGRAYAHHRAAKTLRKKNYTVSTKSKAREFLAQFYLGQMKFFIKFGGLVPESTQDTTAVAFPTKPL